MTSTSADIILKFESPECLHLCKRVVTFQNTGDAYMMRQGLTYRGFMSVRIKS